MIKLYENGVYLLNGTEIVEDTGSAQVSVSKEEAAKNTIAYGVLEAHNTSSDMKMILLLSELFRQPVLRVLRSFRFHMY